MERRFQALCAASPSLARFAAATTDISFLSDPIFDEGVHRACVERAFAREGLDGLRLEKRRRLAHIAAWDLVGEISLEEAGAALSAVADACLDMGLRAVDAPEELSVIALGKLGARELNYISDIDIVFISDGNLERSTRAATALLNALGGYSPHGAPYIVDVNLRPEGRNGALVRSLQGMLEYYGRWAQPWEHQALIKARAAAGHESTAGSFVNATRELVFRSDIDGERIASIRNMKSRLENHAARRTGTAPSTRDVKLCPGGIRDIEFCAQLLQLVHGGSDSAVRSPATLAALQALAAGGYLADDDAAALDAAYRWLRAVEHRVQLRAERRTHTVPKDDDKRARLARALGLTDEPAAGALERFDARHYQVLADVRGRFERIFYRPMIESLAAGAAVRLSADALKERLRFLGFRDVDRAARTLERLVTGTSRRAKLLRVLTPPMLRWLSESPLPDAGLLAFLHLGQRLGAAHGALGQLRDNPPALALLARALGTGRVLGELLAQAPEEIASLTEAPRITKGRSRVAQEAVASLEWRTLEDRFDGLRRFKRRSLLHIALADIAGAADVRDAGESLSDVADACLEAAVRDIEIPFAVVAMGKLGGRELTYASDIDALFVHDGDQVPAERAAEDVRRAIGELTPEGQAFRIDLGLRPEGGAGVLVRSVAAYFEYYRRWAKPWEYLALVRARTAAGDEALAERLVEDTRAFAWPDGVDTPALAEIRHLKARMERERIPPRVEPRLHLKLGPGTMSDVEFAVQIVQHGHAHEYEELRVTNTLDAIDAARAVGLVDERDAGHLAEAWTFVARVRNCLFLMTGRPVDVFPAKPETLEALGIAMGFGDQPRQEVEEHYLRVTRRARRVAEPLIYG